MDKGGEGGGKNAYPQNVDKKHVFFLNPSLTQFKGNLQLKYLLEMRILIVLIYSTLHLPLQRLTGDHI